MTAQPSVIAALSITLLSLAVFVWGSQSTAQGGGCTSDLDSDGICDVPGEDNCTLTPNPAQRDDDEDGYGNICDWDVIQGCFSGGGPNISATFARSFDSAPWLPKNRGAFDVTEDGFVGAPDLSVLWLRTKQNSGPSSLLCADCAATPTPGPGLGACPPVGP